MNTFDPAGQEFLRISERYRQMSDEELRVLIPQSSDLTPFAQQALANEVRSRGLKAEVNNEEPATPPQITPPTSFERESPELRDWAVRDFLEPDSPYDEDRKLVELTTVWSQRDALKVQSILDAAGIPFFMGTEKATGVDKVTSNFSKGVSVQIMQIGRPWARLAMQRYEPEDDPIKDTEEPGELVVRCPKCHSDEVVFEGRTSELANVTDESSQKFDWCCDACGHHWEDDGVEKVD